MTQTDKVLDKELLKLSVQDNICCVCLFERKIKDDTVDTVDTVDGNVNKSSKLKLKKIMFCCYKVQNEENADSTKC